MRVIRLWVPHLSRSIFASMSLKSRLRTSIVGSACKIPIWAEAQLRYVSATMEQETRKCS